MNHSIIVIIFVIKIFNFKFEAANQALLSDIISYSRYILEYMLITAVRQA